MMRIGIISLCLAALAGCDTKQGPSLPPPTGPGAPPVPAVPALATLAQAASAAPGAAAARAGTGTLEAKDVAELGPKQTGVLAAVEVDEGDRVAKGDVLFRLDAGSAQLAVAQAKAALASARVQRDAARLDFERTQALRERGSVPADAFDQAKSRLDAAESGVAQADAMLGLAQRHAADMVVTSPIDGIVTERRMNVGETATLMPPSIVLVVQNVDTLELRARLPETALRTVREGSELEVGFPALARSRRVNVKRIAPNVDPRTRTIEIVAEIDNSDHALKAGMLAEVAYAPSAEGAAVAPAAPATQAAEPTPR